MECMHCKGTMEKGSAPFGVDRRGYHIHWDAIPAWVCPQCGEYYFDRKEVDAIQRMIEQVDATSREMQPAA